VYPLIRNYGSLQTVGRTPWTRDEPCHKAVKCTGQHRHRRNADRSMPQVGFDPTIPVSMREKIFYALDGAATVICSST
jgi:hypothetical protein